ncbi:MAG: uracil-DNA glycosylase family protein [Duncaniella sp.]|nr:uracil-DNA glycosylase family protein [Duncaniella sp.]
MEVHPWPPFYNRDSKILIMGTFPPQPKRWSMNFYYPNPTNDFWPMMALIFLGDRKALNIKDSKQFDLNAIKELLTEHHIAMNDTGHKVRRLMGNASDKFLEIIEPVDLDGLLKLMPDCRTVATTGEKAAGVIARLTDTEIPKMGDFVTSSSGLEIWRMPSTSRAYPLKLEKKAEYYAGMFRAAGILP